MDEKQKILNDCFGLQSFRNNQEKVIDALLSRKDVLCIMPTGSGKSICYQIPALMMSGITIVISPLISLMKDQVASLKSKGIQAAYINSSLSQSQIQQVYNRISVGKYKIIYVAPERLSDKIFNSVLSNNVISMVTIDEAHCISKWGYDFRPSYMTIKNFIMSLPKRPVVSAFTATATKQVRNDIMEYSGLYNPMVLVSGFDRPNLFFNVIKTDRKFSKLIELLDSRLGKNGIIYCLTRKQVEDLFASLSERKYPVTKYHAGLPAEERRKSQEKFFCGAVQIMVATNAFGMGIDKSDISFVIHYSIPKSMDEYYQESGRAGRDGALADCILLYSSNDIRIVRNLIMKSTSFEHIPPEEKQKLLDKEYNELKVMVDYCTTTNCLRGFILDYFGQIHPQNCNNCSNCNEDYVELNVTTESKIIMSCIERIKNSIGKYTSIALVIRTLLGSKDKRIIDQSLDQLSTYGLMKYLSRSSIREIIDGLIEQKYLLDFSNELRLTNRAKSVLFKNEEVTIRTRDSSELNQRMSIHYNN